MAVTVTLDKRTNQAGGSLGVWLARGKKIQEGAISFAAAATFTASSNFVLTLDNIDYVEINDASGYSFEYQYGDEGILCFGPDGSSISAPAVAEYTDVKFIAVGD